MAVLATALGLQSARSAPTTLRPGQAQLVVSYSFPAQRYASGLVVTRRWALGSEHGSQLTETLTASSATGKALTAWFKESIPAAIASSVQTLRFTSAPVRIVSPDPVVEWYLRLPVHGTVTIGYVASVAPEGATAARLAGWAKGLNVAEKRLNVSAGRKPRAAASPTASATAAAPSLPTQAPSPSASAGGNPNPFPTYTCDPTMVSCTPSG